MIRCVFGDRSRRGHGRMCCLVGVTVAVLASGAARAADGFLWRDGKELFPIGSYEFPEADAAVAEMAAAGVNLVRCHGKDELDRAQAAGLLGWVSLPFQQGAGDVLKLQVESLMGHDALAVWEGPDEVVWNFTAYSGLYKSMGVYESRDEWWRQTPKAIAYSESRAAEIIPNMRAAVEQIRGLDTKQRPVWINEAQKSDVRLVREYLDFVDITGCDIYPVSGQNRDIAAIGGTTDRWNMLGKGKPVWMVLQAFSWDELGGDYAEKGRAYPSFRESRFMAYDAIAHGARGILYWGSQYLTSDEFRRSLYALTAELAALQPFLVAADEPDVCVRLIELPEDTVGRGVTANLRHVDEDWLVVLVNEDDTAHMGVEVSGLAGLDGRELLTLYDEGSTRVKSGELLMRMQPLEVKVLATSRAFETSRRDGRDYAGE